MGKTDRKLHDMNGDYLNKLKKPLCSEFSTNVRGTLNANKEEHRKRVELMFKDRNLVLNKLKRSQDAVYKTLLRVHKHKKTLEREQYKKHQEEVRAGFEYQDQSRTSKREGDPDEATETGKAATPDRLVVAGSNSNEELPDETKDSNQRQERPPIATKASPDCVDDQNTKENEAPINQAPKLKPVQKSRVLEVRKDPKAAPIVRERSSTEESIANATRSLVDPFPNINEVLPPIAKGVNENRGGKQVVKEPYHLPELKKVPLISKPPPPKYYLQERSTMEAISEEMADSSKGRSREQAMPSVAQSWPSVSSKLHSSSHSRSSGSRRIGQAEINRRKAAEKEEMLKEILAKEPIVEYVLDRRHNVVPDIRGFHRKTFQPPSLREKHQQHKMLRSQLDATIKQRENIESFFSKIELENEEKAEFRRRQLAKMAAEKAAQEEAEREAKRSMENLGSTLTQLMAAFNRPSMLADGVDPNSVEALQICKYVRDYQPLDMSEEERRDAQLNKISSWDHVAHHIT